MADWLKIIAGKTAIAQQGNKPGKTNANNRVPAGQTEVKNFPVLNIGLQPSIDKADWSLRIYGLVEKEINLNWAAFEALTQMTDVSDFHCVTRWSQLDMDWQGVRAQDILNLAVPLSTAKFVTLHGYDGYTTNLNLDALLDDDVLVAHSVLGQPLTREHGAPARLIVPKRYAWKGAKWLKAIELHAEDKLGFWEMRGYHNYADPFLEQRFSDD